MAGMVNSLFRVQVCEKEGKAEKNEEKWIGGYEIGSSQL
jgi:hypothetical protein